MQAKPQFADHVNYKCNLLGVVIHSSCSPVSKLARVLIAISRTEFKRFLEYLTYANWLCQRYCEFNKFTQTEKCRLLVLVLVLVLASIRRWKVAKVTWVSCIFHHLTCSFNLFISPVGSSISASGVMKTQRLILDSLVTLDNWSLSLEFTAETRNVTQC